MDTQQSTVYRPTREALDTHPHACYDGLVYMGYVAYDEEIGEEVERLEVVPCRWCAEYRAVAFTSCPERSRRLDRIPGRRLLTEEEIQRWS